MINRKVNSNSLVLENEEGKMILEIVENIDNETASFELIGNISMQVSHDFEDELISVSTVCNHIFLDFSKATSISSAGLKTLLKLQQMLDKRQGTRMKLTGIKNGVYKSFEETGFLELFNIED